MEWNNEYKKIFNFHDKISNRLVSRESGWLEFKESFNWNSKSGYSKSMVAFANKKGGFIVFGIKDKPRDLMGLQSNNFEDIDEAKISEYLNSVFSPEIDFDKFIVMVNKNKIGILYIHQSDSKPIICIKSDRNIKEAEIYYRYNARSEKIKYPELKILIEQIQERERKNWMKHLERISKIGSSDAAVLDILGGKVDGVGGTVVIDKKLIPKLRFITEGRFREKGFPTLKLIGDVKPVSITGYKQYEQNGNRKLRITDDPKAPLVRIKEDDLLKEYLLSYRDLTRKLRKRYSDFKENFKYHKLRKRIMKDSRFCRTRYLDPHNPSSTKKDFYHPRILKEFSEHYTLKNKKVRFLKK